MNPYRDLANVEPPKTFRITRHARRWVRVRQWVCGELGHDIRTNKRGALLGWPVCDRCGKPLSNSSVMTPWLRRRSERETALIAAACRIDPTVRHFVNTLRDHVVEDGE